MLTEVASLWKLPRELHEVLEDLVSILAEVLLLDRAAVSIVDLMATGLEIVKLATGRISVTAVGNEVI